MKQFKIKQLNNRNLQNILDKLPANGCEELARNIREILAKDKKNEIATVKVLGQEVNLN